MSRSQLPSAVVRGSLRDGLLVCLGLLERDSARYEAAAVAWHARWCEELPGVGFAESRGALAALEALAGPDPVAASRNLCAACEHDGLEELAQVIDAWLERHPRRLLGAGSDGSG
jgi:hypothetical protein